MSDDRGIGHAGGEPDPFRLILYAHGSRDPRWREPFERMADELRAAPGIDNVRLVYMEFVPPTLQDAAAEAASQGVGCLRILPLFLAGGAHVDRDIPEQVAATRKRFPGLRIEVLPPVGEDRRFASLLRTLATEAARRPVAAD